jgi:hypothetical protein
VLVVASGRMDKPYSNLAAAIRAFAEMANGAKPDVVHIEIARSDLDAAAYSIEHGEISQGALRLFLACQDLYACIGEVDQDYAMMDELREALQEEFSIYLDTNIISAMAKPQDLRDDDLQAMEQILDAHQAGLVGLYTSEHAKEELDRIPEAFRKDHIRLYRLLKLVGEPEQSSPDEDEPPALNCLRNSLSSSDFDHFTQAVASRVNVFVTTDNGILSQKNPAATLGISLLRPREVVAELRRLRILA